MFAEEQFLRRKFGDQYLEWSKEVPAFIPKFKNFRRSDQPMNWKKVLRKEKNGLLALFLIFFVFNLVGEIIQEDDNYNLFVFAMFGLVSTGYLLLKYLEKKTNLLKG